jgi:hypothetical protein
MLAYFYKGVFIGMWQDQRDNKDWLPTTIKALGHDKKDVEVYDCPPIKTNTPYYFDENKKLVVQESVTILDANKKQIEAKQWNDSKLSLGKKFHPAE